MHVAAYCVLAVWGTWLLHQSALQRWTQIICADGASNISPCCFVQLERRNEVPVSSTEVLLDLECSPKGKWEHPWHALPQPTCPLWAAPKALLFWDAALAGRGRACSALLSPSSFHLSSFVSTSAKHFWSGSSCSLGNRQAHKKATSGPFLFLLSLTGFFFVHLPFYQGPCGVNCWSLAWPLSISSPRGFPCAYVFAVTLSTAYSTLGLARSLTGFLSQGLLLPNLGFFFSAFYSDLWIKMESLVIWSQYFQLENSPFPRAEAQPFGGFGCIAVITSHLTKSTSNWLLLLLFHFPSLQIFICLKAFIQLAFLASLPGPCISQVCYEYPQRSCCEKQMFL